MSDSNKIICPNCSHEFAIADVLAKKIKAKFDIEAQKLHKELENQKAEMTHARDEFEKAKNELKKKELELLKQVDEKVDAEIETRERQIKQELREEMKMKAEKRFKLEKEEMQKELEEKESELQTIKKQELELRKREREINKHQGLIEHEREEFEKKSAELEKARKKMQQQIENQVATELELRETELRKSLRKDLRKKAEKQFAVEKEEMQKELEEKESELQTIKKQELELRKRERELESKKNEFELVLERKLSEQRMQLLEKAEQNFTEKQKLKMIEKEELIRSLREQINELQRRSEVGSQEAQGEALEKDLLFKLQAAFPFDEFVEVKKGERGHDITQIVRNNLSKTLGTIIWEAKNAKTFSKGWIDKLKTDLQRKNADYAMLVTLAMPKDVEHFEQIDNIWVTDYKSAFSLCAVLRSALAEIVRVKATEEYRDSLRDTVYNYVTGVEFKRHLNRIHDAFQKMRDDLGKEKKAIQRHWKMREKNIENIITSVVNIDGDISGYLALESGKPLLEGLALENLSDSDDSDESSDE